MKSSFVYDREIVTKVMEIIDVKNFRAKVLWNIKLTPEGTMSVY